jgi:hypothetical protein
VEQIMPEQVNAGTVACDRQNSLLQTIAIFQCRVMTENGIEMTKIGRISAARWLIGDGD